MRRVEQTHELKAELVRALEAAGLPFQAAAVSECGKWFKQWRCDSCGARDWSVQKGCQFKLCPFCQQARSARAYAIYHRALGAVAEPKMLVLTVKNSECGDLRSSLYQLGRCLRGFWRKSLKKRARGALVAIEVTFNREQKSWHPHAHLLLDADFIEQKWIATEWRKITHGWGQVVWIEQAKKGWERELLKYVTKQLTFLDVPEALREFVFASKRFRFLRGWGTFYNLKEEDVEGERARLCPECGAPMVFDKGFVALEWFLRNENGVYGYEAGEWKPPPGEGLTHVL